MAPREARSQLATHTYFHVCARGNNGQNLFIDDLDRHRYLHLFEKYRRRFNLKCFAYCLMTNHVHFLILAPSIRVLSRVFHALHVAYVVYFNHRYQRTGHLFQDRFTSWVIQDQEHLLSAKEYIENNPVQAGLVAEKRDYPWSSALRDGSAVSISGLMD